MSSGLSNETIDGGAPRTDGPTIEEYVQAGYQPANYPPDGYAEKPSPGLDAFRAYQADPHDAKKHAEAANCLGVSVGELTHGKVGELVEFVARGVHATPTPEAVAAAVAAENRLIAEAHGIDLGALPPQSAGGTTDVSRLAEDVGEQQLREEAARNARATDLYARRASDPGSLTAAEVAELDDLEAGGVDAAYRDPGTGAGAAAPPINLVEDLGVAHEPTDAELDDLTRPGTI